MPEVKKMRFKVLSGCHRVTERGPDGQYVRDESGQIVKKTYRKGDVLESEFDLVKKFGIKFKKLGKNDPVEDEEDEDEIVPPADDDGLEAMSDEDLRKFAQDAGVEPGKKSRKTLIEAVRAALAVA